MMMRWTWIPAATLVLTCLMGGASHAHEIGFRGEASAKCEDSDLCIGVRRHVRPFAYKPRTMHEVPSDAARGPLRKRGYTGYMVKICDAVLAEMTINPGIGGPLAPDRIGIYDIDLDREVRQREQAAECNKPVDEREDEKLQCPAPIQRFDGALGEKFDILCDPATISNDRRDLDYMISTPLFLTGIAYLYHPSNDAPSNPCSNDYEDGTIGVVGGTNAGARGIRALIDYGELPKYRSKLITYLRYDEPCPSNPVSSLKKGDAAAAGPATDKAQEPDDFRIIRAYSTHPEAAKAFCDGKLHYYLGDLEIIIENVRTIPGCDYEVSTTTYTNDRYAIFGRARRNGDHGEDAGVERKPEELSKAEKKRALLVSRFFEVLAQKTIFHPSVVDRAFSDTFQNAKPSRKLDAFYWSIRGARE